MNYEDTIVVHWLLSSPIHTVFYHVAFSVILGPLWQTFVSSLRVYTQASIEGVDDPYDGRYDSDGAEQSLESFVIQVRKPQGFCTVAVSSMFIASCIRREHFEL